MASDETRAKKLVARQREYRLLREERKPMITEFNRAQKKLRTMNKRIAEVGQAIYDLKHDGDTPEVTDHAVVRYLERIEGVDILSLKVKVANHKQAHREGNVVVTVNEDVTQTNPEAKENE